MTEPTPDQIQRACDMLHGEYEVSSYGEPNYYELTALADTIAQLDAMQAERDKARADLGEIDRIATRLSWKSNIYNRDLRLVAAIAAPYKVETDPVDDLINAIAKQMLDGPLGVTWHELLRAELAKCGIPIGRSHDRGRKSPIQVGMSRPQHCNDSYGDGGWLRGCCQPAPDRLGKAP